MTTPHNNEALEVGQEISLFDCRWKIEGIHLGALGQESLIELKSLTHKAGWTGQWEYHPMVFVPEPFVRVALTRANQRASEAPPTAQGVEGEWQVNIDSKDYKAGYDDGLEEGLIEGREDANEFDRDLRRAVFGFLEKREQIESGEEYTAQEILDALVQYEHYIKTSALTHPREQQREDEVIEGLDDALKNAKVFGAMEHLVGRTPPMIRCENRTQATKIFNAAKRYARQSSGRGEGDDAFYELCSQCWDALGITEYTGKHIVEHIHELKEQAALKQSPKEKMGEVDVEGLKMEVYEAIRVEKDGTHYKSVCSAIDYLLSQGIISGGK